MKDKAVLVLILPVICIGAVILELGIALKKIFAHQKKKYKTPLLNSITNRV